VWCRSRIARRHTTPLVDLSDKIERDAAIAWWEELIGRGGEGMVIKPAEFVPKGPRGLLQPALKCRAREYLRIIYGPDYTMPEHMERLRERGLGRKGALALREFALGVEGLQRFVHVEPLRRIHECAFGVFALESEPVDLDSNNSFTRGLPECSRPVNQYVSAEVVVARIENR
jgi:protein phosphatase